MGEINYILVGWIIAIILFATFEIVTMGLATIWFAIGALIGLMALIFGAPFYIQFALFLISSLVLLAFTRPILVDHLKLGKVKTNLDIIIGSTGIVLEDIKSFSMGKVKVNGQIWSAISEGDHIHIHKDTLVKVCNIEGVKLIVKEEKEED